MPIEIKNLDEKMKVFLKNALMFRLKRLGVLRQTIRCFRACKINHLHFFTIVILPENEELGVKFRVTMK